MGISINGIYKDSIRICLKDWLKVKVTYWMSQNWWMCWIPPRLNRMKLADAEIKKKEINEKREQYRSVAFGGSALYFCIIEINEKREQYRSVAALCIKVFERRGCFGCESRRNFLKNPGWMWFNCQDINLPMIHWPFSENYQIESLVMKRLESMAHEKWSWELSDTRFRRKD